MSTTETMKKSGVRPLPERPGPPRSLQVYVVCFWLLLGAFIGFVLWKLVTGELRIIWENPWIGSFAFLGLGFLIAYRFGRKQVVRNFLGPHGGFVCPTCHYGLRSLDDEGVCPECGTEYTRASVVGLWEHTYKLGMRYPRVSARGISAYKPPVPTPKGAESPWSKWNLPDALGRVEAGARQRGFVGARFAGLAREFDAACARLGRPLPSDLHHFLATFDPAMWTKFVRSTRVQSAGVEPTKIGELGAWADVGPVVVEHVRIRRPEELMVGTLSEHSTRDAGARAFRDQLWVTTRAATWEQTQLIAFADGSGGEILYYATDPPDLPRGCIITFPKRTADRSWLADSLSQWLTRLAVCGGVECALGGEAETGVDPALVRLWKEEQAIRNAAQVVVISQVSSSSA